jgi:hypothetical protein
MSAVSSISNNRWSLVSLVAVFLASLALGAGPPKEPPRVGQIIIIGNEETPQTVVLERLSVFPGQRLDEAALRSSQNALRKTGFWKSARIECRPNPFMPDSPFLDVVVTIEERPYNWLRFGVVYELNEFLLTFDPDHLHTAVVRLAYRAEECGLWAPRWLTIPLPQSAPAGS